MFKGSIKNLIEKQICEEALKVINTNGARELETLNLKSRINNYLTIDYSLTKAPLFSASFFESYHKGKFVGDSLTDQVHFKFWFLGRAWRTFYCNLKWQQLLFIIYKNNIKYYNIKIHKIC